MIRTLAGTSYGGFNGDYHVALESDLSSPCGVAVCLNGDIYIADTYNHRVRKFSIPQGNILLKLNINLSITVNKT